MSYVRNKIFCPSSILGDLCAAPLDSEMRLLVKSHIPKIAKLSEWHLKKLFKSWIFLKIFLRISAFVITGFLLSLFCLPND